MKIVALTVAGFGPFKHEQRIDFDAFDDDGIFLITGRTGAGKSSILDAVCYALYGSIPRFDGSQQKLRSDHCAPQDPSSVSLEFTVDGTLYRVVRSPEFERPKRRGTGTTTSPPTALLFRRLGSDAASDSAAVAADERWEGLAARPVDVAPLLLKIIGLTRDQFLQVILLAQNRFQHFLRSSNDDRQSVLRSLFGTERFLTYESLLIDRLRTQESYLLAARTALEGYADDLARLDVLPPVGQAAVNLLEQPAHDASWFAGAVLQLQAKLDRATVEAGHTATLISLTEAALAHLVDLQSRQQRRDSAAHAHRALQVDSAEIIVEKARLEAGERARLVWPYLLTHTEAAQSQANAVITVETARRDFSSGDDRHISRAPLLQHLDNLQRLRGSLDDSLAEERLLPARAAAAKAREHDYARSVLDESELAIRLADLPGRSEELASAITIAHLSAERETLTREHVDALTVATDAALRATALVIELQIAEATEFAASIAHVAAAQHHQALMEQRLAGHAAELATDLVAGNACVVCGSLTHPAPATSTVDPVSRAMVDSARLLLTERQQEMDAATRARVTVATSVTEAQARTDGLSVEQRNNELAAARIALEACRADRQRGELLTRERAECVEDLQAGLLERSILQQTQQLLLIKKTESQSVYVASLRRIETQRGDSESISALVEDVSGQLSRARRLLDAIDSQSRADLAVESARALLNQKLLDSGCADEHSARAANLTAQQREAGEQRVRLWEQGIATAAAILADPLLEGLPESDPHGDSDARSLAEHQLQAARDNRDTAVALLAGAIHDHDEATRLEASAQVIFESSAAQQQQFDLLRGLANAVQGKEPNNRRMRLETYVLAAQLEEIVTAANLRLSIMTSGRYQLEHDDSVQYRGARSGLGLSILDGHTGRTRATNSLSGGETFLASLALALGLAEVVTSQSGGIKLDTLFIDEGFGSLDDETLDVAMSTLDGLRSGGRTIGLISHVGSMKEQIAATLAVRVTPQGDSVIEARSH